MGIVANSAIVLSSWMLDLGVRNLFSLLFVTDSASRFDIFLRQHHLAVLGWLMAILALFVIKGIVPERLQQVRRIRLPWVMTLNAVCLLKRLTMMGLD